jgi:hypothetical protein
MTKLRAKKIHRFQASYYLRLHPFVAIFAVGYFRSYTQSLQSINVISPITYGQVDLVGTLYKETPVGTKGPYLIVNSAGNVAELDMTSNIDYLVGQSVRVRET